VRLFFYSRPTTPFVFSSTVTLQQGQRVIPDVSELASPFRAPVLINEIRFSVGAGQVPHLVRDMSPAILCQFSVGRAEFSPMPIPISMYCTSMQRLVMEAQAASDLIASDIVFVLQHRWKLPVPLLVPSGSALTAQLSRVPEAGATDDVTVSIAYAGCYLDSSEPLPDKIQVPYVTAFYPPPEGWFDASSLSTFYLTTERQLKNVLDIPVNVQRFIGRFYFISDNNIVEFTDDGTTVVEMKDSYGRSVVKDPSPFGSLFDFNRRAWTFSKILGPREQYSMSIRNAATTNLPLVSMVGWREEVFR